MKGEGREGRGEGGCWGRAMGLGSGKLDKTEVQQNEELEVGWGGETCSLTPLFCFHCGHPIFWYSWKLYMASRNRITHSPSVSVLIS